RPGPPAADRRRQSRRESFPEPDIRVPPRHVAFRRTHPAPGRGARNGSGRRILTERAGAGNTKPGPSGPFQIPCFVPSTPHPGPPPQGGRDAFPPPLWGRVGWGVSSPGEAGALNTPVGAAAPPAAARGGRPGDRVFPEEGTRSPRPPVNRRQPR